MLTQELFTTHTEYPTNVRDEFESSGWSDSLLKANITIAHLPDSQSAAISEYYTSGQRQKSFVGADAARKLKGHDRKYGHLIQGGWMCLGADLAWDEPSPVIKPFQPRHNTESGKVVKYETLQGMNAAPVLLEVPEQLALDLLIQYGYGRDEMHEAGGFWPLVAAHPDIPLTITEGVKKAGALLEAGQVAIALRGVWNFRTVEAVTGEKVLHLSLLKLLEHPGRTIRLGFDQDEKASTIAQVTKAKHALSRILVKQGHKVADLVWDGRQGKGIDDFLGTAEDRANVLHQLTEAAMPVDAQLKIEQAGWTLKELTRTKAGAYLPEIYTSGNYLSTLPTPNLGDLIVLKAATGSGKTTAFREQIAPYAKSAQLFTIVLTPTNGLGRQVAEKIGYPHYRSSTFNWESAKLAGGVVLCAEGLPGILHRITSPTAKISLVMDECQQICDQIAAGKTTGNRQSAIVEALATTAKKATTTGFILAMEAGVCDRTIDFLAKISQPANVRLWEHDRQQEPWMVSLAAQTHHAEGFMAELAEAAHQAPILISTDSQKASERLQVFLEADGIENILRVDSDTSDLPEVQRFLADPDREIISNQYQAVITSPSAKSGLSIDVEYFSAVYGYFVNLAADSAMQQLARVRQPVPRHIFTKPFLPFNKGMAFSQSAEAIVQNDRRNLRGIGQALGLHSEQLEDLLREHSLTDALHLYQAEAARYENKQRCIHGDCLAAWLEADGHSIEFTAYGAHPSDAWSEAGEVVDARRAKELADTQIDQLIHNEQWLKEAMNNSNLPKADRLIVRKFNLRRDFPGLMFDDADFCLEAVIKGHGTLIKAAKELTDLAYLETLKAIDANELAYRAANLQTQNLTAVPKRHARAMFLRLSGIEQIIDGIEYSNRSAEALAIAEFFITNSDLFNVLFDLNATTAETPCEIIAKVLKRLGLKGKIIRKEGARGAQLSIRWCDRYESRTLRELEESRHAYMKAKRLELQGPSEAEFTYEWKEEDDEIEFSYEWQMVEDEIEFSLEWHE